MAKARPVKPGEVAAKKKKSFPDAVLESFNELLAEKCVRGRATILQKDLIARMVAKGLKRDEIFGKGWLDVESVYESSGWKVEYDGPAYNESYDAYFTFEKK